MLVLFVLFVGVCPTVRPTDHRGNRKEQGFPLSGEVGRRRRRNACLRQWCGHYGRPPRKEEFAAKTPKTQGDREETLQVLFH